MRGAGTSGTLVLVDGVRIGSATLGQADSRHLSLAQIERIEILRGPASSLYGADARRRRDPDLHPARQRRAARAGAAGGRRLSLDARATSASAARKARSTTPLSLAAETSDGVSAVRPGDAFGTFNPDEDGF